jgi:asparagine synthase (glutamine-hydrolysing)
VTVQPEELARDLDEMIFAQGEPFGSTSIYAQYRVFKLAKEKGIKVTLDGQGADELLAGYLGYPGQRLRSLLEEGNFLAAWNFLSSWCKNPGRSLSLGLKLFAGQITGNFLHEKLRLVKGERLRPDWLNQECLKAQNIQLRFPHRLPVVSPKKRRLVAELNASLVDRGLPALLRHGDRNSMHFSIESRVPFLTPSFAQMLLSMPESYLVSKEGTTKYVFREAMRGIVPDRVLDRKDKIGFATPEADWLKVLGPKARGWLQDAEGIDLLNTPKMLAQFDRVMNGEIKFSWQIWRWINFSRWHQHYFRN